MNKIEQELENVITNISLGKFDTYEDLQSIRKDIAKDSYSLLEQHCIDFNRWCFNNYCYDYDLNQWRDYGEEEVPHTTEELFKQYCLSL